MSAPNTSSATCCSPTLLERAVGCLGAPLATNSSFAHFNRSSLRVTARATGKRAGRRASCSKGSSSSSRARRIPPCNNAGKRLPRASRTEGFARA